MKYEVIRNESYDFIGESYKNLYPNIHKYPATMLPQIGIKILKELGIGKNSKLLDPYCGSGSTFSAGLEVGIKYMKGYDLNPLAVLICKAKFTKISLEALKMSIQYLREQIYEYLKFNNASFDIPKINNLNFWFKDDIIKYLSIIRHFVLQIKNDNIRRVLLVAFSELVRDCSNTRNNEFKLYKMKDSDILNFNPNVLELFWSKLENIFKICSEIYQNRLADTNIDILQDSFKNLDEKFDIVLTSPPYGDSRTTVAYGQFSTLSNEWLDVKDARKLDKNLMGGERSKELLKNSLITKYLSQISNQDNKRALEISGFYNDLKNSIDEVSKSVNKNGKIIYVVGNRMVKGVRLPTDQFIAECFESNNFKHLITYERLLSNKSMPKKNSPTNKTGITKATMNYEYIVCCEKK